MTEQLILNTIDNMNGGSCSFTLIRDVIEQDPTSYLVRLVEKGLIDTAVGGGYVRATPMESKEKDIKGIFF